MAFIETDAAALACSWPRPSLGENGVYPSA